MVSEKTVRLFWEKVQKTDTCWIWTASKRYKGYGAFCWKDGTTYLNGRAHRFAYQLLVGPIPDGMFVLHKCDVPACVNPEHLFLGTNQDNVDDMMRKGRHVSGGTYGPGNYKRGTEHWRSKLTPDDVREMRRLYSSGGATLSQLARKYGVNSSCISKVVNKDRWSHVE